MEGVTDPILRSALAKLGGIGTVCTEFVRITGTPCGSERLAASVQKTPHAHLSVQVMGRDIEPMAQACGVVARAGADAVDINLGCPTPRAARGGVGAAMLQDPRLLAQVIDAMRAATPGVLSAKIRAGVHKTDGIEPIQTARLLVDCGVDLLTVHPRRSRDGYTGVADWKVVADVADAVSIPVVGNGDLWSAGCAHRMFTQTKVAGLMFGRPALRNPYLFLQWQDLMLGDQARPVSGEMLFNFFAALMYAHRDSGASDKALMGRSKEWLRYMCRVLDDGGAFKHAILRETDFATLIDKVGVCFGPLGASDIDAQEDVVLEKTPG